MMDVRFTPTTTGLRCEVLDADGTPVEAPFPLAETAEESLPLQLRVLEQLWIEERVLDLDQGFVLAWDDVFDLAPEMREPLGIPDPIQGTRVELRTTGYAGGTDFRVHAIISHSDLGLLPAEGRTGPLYHLRSGPVLVGRAEWEALRLLDDPFPGDVASQLLLIGSLKQAARGCRAELDTYLTSQDIVRPEGLSAEIEGQAPDRIELRAVPAGVDAEAFPAFGRDRGPTRGSYTKAEGMRRKRLVLSPEERTATDAVKERREISGTDVPKFLSNPEAYLPEAIDLSKYSLRVKGLVPRKYQSQPYMKFEKSGQRDWFDASIDIDMLMDALPFQPDGPAADPSFQPRQEEPGTVGDTDTGVDSPSAGTPPNVPPEKYAEFCQQVVDTGERFVLHGDDWIEIDPHTAERFLSAWDLVEEAEPGHYGISRENVTLVLDVFSNVEALEYEPETAVPEPALELLPDLPEYPTPASMRATLMPHQQIGYRWMRYLHERTYGGLLADDMGLGKTVQVIAVMAHLLEQSRLRPALIVLPSAVLENWQSEIERFCPDIGYIYQHRGTGRLRNPERIAAADVVLTTYETLRRDQLILGQIDWSVIVCDEAQKVKNPTAQSTSAVKGMKAGLRLALTGTPVENGLSELWCIVDFAQPGKLGSRREFRDDFERPVQEAAGAEGARFSLASRLQEALTPHYLRRAKEDVLQELAAKTETQLFVDFGPRQQAVYNRLLAQVRRGEIIPIAALQKLIQACSHPEVVERTGAPIESLIDECPKLATTMQKLDDIRGRGEKVLIFTRYLGMQDILQSAISHRFGLHAQIINGTITESRRRLDLVDQFNEAPGFRAMILSPDAAGVGLNITGANHVIHYTRLWNPAKENQATDRVHRIGQTRPVTVYYPIIVGDGFHSVEERLDELLAEKKELARDVVWPREGLSVDREMKDFLATATGGDTDG